MQNRLFWGKVTHNLVTEQVEINPFGTRSTFRATKYCAVECSRGVEVGDRKRKMERLHSCSLAEKPAEISSLSHRLLRWHYDCCPPDIGSAVFIA